VLVSLISAVYTLARTHSHTHAHIIQVFGCGKFTLKKRSSYTVDRFPICHMLVVYGIAVYAT